MYLFNLSKARASKAFFPNFLLSCNMLALISAIGFFLMETIKTFRFINNIPVDLKEKRQVRFVL